MCSVIVFCGNYLLLEDGHYIAFIMPFAIKAFRLVSSNLRDYTLLSLLIDLMKVFKHCSTYKLWGNKLLQSFAASINTKEVEHFWFECYVFF